MTRTLIGLDYEGIAAIKIAKGTFDPKTTDDSLRSRFYFNSKWPNQVNTPEIEVATYTGSAGTNYHPAGSNVNTCAMMIRNSLYSFRGKFRWPNIRYDLPMVDFVDKTMPNGRYQQLKMTDREFGDTSGAGTARGGYVGTGGRGGFFRRREIFSGGVGGTYSTWDYSPSDIGGSATAEETLIVWNLPGDETPLDNPTAPTPIGKMTVQIGEDWCRVAKPGFDVRTATPAQLAFDSSGRPVGVVAADDIAIPAGLSSYNTGMSIPENCYIEMSCYDDNAIFYPMKLTGNNDGYGIEYWVDGALIRFNNTQRACRARFIAMAVDPAPPTSGSNNVLKQFTEGGEVVTQFLRPGAGANPRFADIIIDSRRPVVQLLADGYFTVPDHIGSWNTPTETVVNYSAPGFFPYVKYMTVHGTGLTKEVRVPRVNRRYQNSVSIGGLAGDASYCQYSTTSARFYTAKGRPRYMFYNSSTGTNYRYDDNPIVGIRWFVLGIPT